MPDLSRCMCWRADQKDWDVYAERLAFALNAAQGIGLQGDSVRLVARSESPGSNDTTKYTKRHECEPRRWRYGVQRQYRRAREQVNQLLQSSMEGRTRTHNRAVADGNVEAGVAVP